MSVLGLRKQMTTIWGLKTTETYSLTVLEAGSLKSRCQRGSVPPKIPGRMHPWLFLVASGSACGCIPPDVRSSGEGPSCLFQLLGAPGVLGLWPHPSSVHLHLHAAVFPVCLPFLLQGHHRSLDFGPHANPGRFHLGILNYLHISK